jgi:hypothetical protein
LIDTTTASRLNESAVETFLHLLARDRGIDTVVAERVFALDSRRGYSLDSSPALFGGLFTSETRAVGRSYRCAGACVPICFTVPCRPSFASNTWQSQESCSNAAPSQQLDCADSRFA